MPWFCYSIRICLHPLHKTSSSSLTCSKPRKIICVQTWIKELFRKHVEECQYEGFSSQALGKRNIHAIILRPLNSSSASLSETNYTRNREEAGIRSEIQAQVRGLDAFIPIPHKDGAKQAVSHIWTPNMLFASGLVLKLSAVPMEATCWSFCRTERRSGACWPPATWLSPAWLVWASDHTTLCSVSSGTSTQSPGCSNRAGRRTEKGVCISSTVGLGAIELIYSLSSPQHPCGLLQSPWRMNFNFKRASSG